MTAASLPEFRFFRTIRIDDPDRRETVVQVRAKCDVPYLVTPRALAFQRDAGVDQTPSMVQKLVVRLLPTSGDGLDLGKITATEACSGLLTVSNGEVDASRSEVSFLVTLAGGIADGSYSGSILISSAQSSKGNIRIPVTIEIRPELSLSPQTLVLHATALPTQKSILLLSNKSTHADISTISLAESPGASLAGVREVRDGLLSISLKFDKKFIPSESGLLFLLCGEKRLPIHVRLASVR